VTHLGLFEGIGGFSLAAHWMNWETKAWCEIEPFCQEILHFWFPSAKGYADITKTDFSSYENKIDILTGGFPCQPFSSAGKRLGTADPRHLWPEMLRAIRQISPVWIVGENVLGIASWNEQQIFEQICADLESAGYEVQAINIPACAVGAPHERQRIWFVAYSYKAARKRENGGVWDFVNTGKCGAYPYTSSTGLEKRPQSGKRKFGKKGREKCQHYGVFSGPIIANADQGPKSEQIRGVFSELGNSFDQSSTDTTSTRRNERPRESDAKRALQNIPDWEGFPTFSPFCGANDGLPDGLDRYTIWSKDRKHRLTGYRAEAKIRIESLKAYGNAIVPQVAYQIFQAIVEADKKLRNAG
jgi:DNA (cytosine-5)-methyltransferase 1